MKKISAIIGIILFYLLLIVNIGKAATPIGEYGTEITSSTITNTLITPNVDNLGGNTAVNNLGVFSDLGHMKNMTVNTEYIFRYANAFRIGDNYYDLRIIIKPISIGTECTMEVTSQKSIWVKAKNSKVQVTYQVVTPGTNTTITGQYFGYGLKDPDGGDYYFNPAGYDIYYVDAPMNTGVYPFKEYYKVYTSTSLMGISRENIYNTEYSDAMIIVGSSGQSSFTFTVDTTRNALDGNGVQGTEDYIKLPVLTHKPRYNISYVWNGGTAGTYAPTSALFEDTVRISNPTKTGNKFTGWTMTGGDGTYAKYGTSASNVTTSWTTPTTTKVKAQFFKNLTKVAGGTVTMRANWLIYSSSLDVNPNGGTVKVTSPTGGTQETISSTKRYTQNYNTTLTLTTPTKASTTTTTTYNISYNGNGGTVGTLTDSNKKSTKKSTTDYTFSSWTKSPNPLNGSLSSNVYTYGPTNGTIDTITANYSSETTNLPASYITLPNATKTGYTLKGWYTASSGGTKRGDAGGTYRPSASETLYAQWQINTSKLKVNPNGGTVKVTSPTGGTQQTISTTTTYTQNYNTTLSLTTPTKEGTTETTTYTVTYNGNSGTVGTTTNANTKATRTDTTFYTFDDWTKSSTFYGTLSSDKKTYTFPANNNVTSTITAKYLIGASTSTTSVTLPTATRTGYTFKGWYTAATGGTKIGNAGETYTPSGDETLYAQWTINHYKVKYNGNGGTQYENANLIARFDGVYNNATSHSSSITTWKDMRETPTAAITSGTWPGSYLNFDGTTWVNMGQMNSNYITMEITFMPTEVPTSVKYLFGNWEGGGGGIYIGSTGMIGGELYINGSYRGISSGITVQANKIYHVALTYDGTTERLYVDGVEKKSESVSGTIGAPSNSTVMAIGGNPNGNSCTPTFKGRVYNASVWNTALTATQIAFDGGKTVSYNSTYGTLPTPQRAGYHFDGWYTSYSGGTLVTSTTPVSTTGDRMLYARWTRVTNPQLIVNPNDGSVSVTSPKGGTAQTITESTTFSQDISTQLSLSTPTKASTSATTTYTISYDGNTGIVGTINSSNTTSTRTDTTTYTFNNWTTSNPFYGTLSNDKKTYTFPANGDVTSIITASYTTNTNIGTQEEITLAEASKLGYTFLGWYTAASGGTRRGGSGDTYIPTSSETLYAHWSATPFNYGITYNLDGGTNDGNNPATYNINSSDINIAPPSKLGYTFTGWQKIVNNLGWSSGYIFYETGIIGTTNTYPYSHYTGLISLKEGVEYTAGNLGGYDSSKIRWKLYTSNGTYLGSTEGNIIGPTCTPTEDCYARILFYATSTSAQRSGMVITANGLEEDVIIPTGSTGNVVLTANWQKNRSTLIVDLGDDDTVTRVINPDGEVFSGPGDFIEEATEFVGNYNNQLIIEDPERNSDAETTIYSVTYNFNGNGEENLIDVATKSESIEYTFTGWAESPSPLNGSIAQTTYNSYPAHIYTYGPNNNAIDVITAEYDSNVIDNGTTQLTLPTPTWKGHTFQGWYTAATGGTKIGDGGSAYTPTSDITLYAHWTENTAVVTIRKNNSNWSNSGINVSLLRDGVEDEDVIVTTNGATVTFSQVEAGTYDIYASYNDINLNMLVDTGVDLVVTSNGTATIDYYTLTLNKGTGVAEVTGAGNYLKNQVASLNSAASPGYTWSSWTKNSGNSPADSTVVDTTVTINQATTLTSNATANTATVTIRKSTQNWSNSGINVALYQNGTSKYAYSTATKSGATVSWSGVLAGTYDIYASSSASTLTSLVDTGIDLIVDSNGSAVIDYYTLTLTKGTGISTVTGAGTYLKNVTANISATVSTGYRWSNWTTNSGNSPANANNASTTVIITEDTSLTANALINTSTLTVNPNGGSVSVTSPTGGTATTITSSTPYTQNYNTTLTLGTPTKASTQNTETYTITYNGNGGTVATLTSDNTTSPRTDTTNYTFSGWTKSSTFYGTLATNNTTYTFPSNNNVTSTITANYSSGISTGDQGEITLPDATKTGYTLAGWYTSASGGTRRGGAGDLYTPSASETLYAQWTPITYTIGYTLNGGSYGTNHPTSGTFDSNVTISNPTRSGYTFTGWTMTNGNTATAKYGTSTTTVTTAWNPATTKVTAQYFKNLRSESGTVTLVATWSDSENPTASIGSTSNLRATTQTLTLSGTDNEGIKQYYFGQSQNPSSSEFTNITTTQNFSKTQSVTAAGTYYLITKDTSNLTSTAASITIDSYTIVNLLETVDGSTTPYTSANYAQDSTGTFIAPRGTVLTIPTVYGTAPAHNDGYIGYSTTYGTTGATLTTTGSPTLSANNSTYYMWFKRATVILTLNKGTGISTVTGAGTYKYGKIVSISATPSTGYRFSKWTKVSGDSPANANSASTTVTLTQNTTLRADGVINTSKLTVNPNYGSVSVTSPTGGAAETITTSKSYTQNYNTTLTLGTPTKASTQNTVTYTIAYNGNGGTVATLTSANTTSPRTDTTNYTFSSWTKSPSTLNGSLSNNVYTYGAANGTTDTITATYSESTVQGTQGQITLPNATNSGYVLAGWYTAASGGTRRGGAGDLYTPSASETLYAHWTEIPVTITIKKDNANWNANSGIKVELRQSGTSKYSATASSSSVSWSPVVAGTYDIYASKSSVALTTLVDTGLDLVVTSSGTVTLDYYTLTLTAGTGISATSGAGIYLKNQSASIDATVSTGYRWSSWTKNSGNSPASSSTKATSVTLTQATTLTANALINTSKLTVYPNGGSVSVTSSTGGSTETINAGKTYTQNYNTTLTFGTPTKGNTTTTTNYTISYNGNNGTVDDLITANTTSGRVDTLEWRFSGWTESDPFYGALSTDNTIYTFPANNNVSSSITANYTSTTITGNQASIILPNAFRPGYVLSGWNTKANGTGANRGIAGATYVPTDSETLYAQWTAIPVTITIKKDNSNWNANSGIKVELRQSGTTKYSATASSSSVLWSPVEAGTYDIYASKSASSLNTLIDTGLDVVVTSSGTATIDYYTLTLQAGVGISAVSGGGTFLKNQTANIDATVSSGYTWEGWSTISGNDPQ